MPDTETAPVETTDTSDAVDTTEVVDNTPAHTPSDDPTREVKLTEPTDVKDRLHKRAAQLQKKWDKEQGKTKEPVVEKKKSTKKVEAKGEPTDLTPAVDGEDKDVKADDNSPDAQFQERLKAHKEKLVVDGEEKELTIEELKRGYGTHQAATKVWQEAAKINKQNENIIGALKDQQRIGQVLSYLGHDVYKLAEQVILERMQWDEKTDVEKENLRLKYELENKGRNQGPSPEERERQTKEAKENRVKQLTQLQQDIIKSVEESDLPKQTPFIVQRVTGMLLNLRAEAEKNGYKNFQVAPKDVVPMVQKEVNTIINGVSIPYLMKALGETKLEELRKEHLKSKNLLPKDDNNKAKKVTPKVQPGNNGRKTMSDVNAYLERIKNTNRI